jgi:hypothetical protein
MPRRRPPGESDLQLLLVHVRQVDLGTIIQQNPDLDALRLPTPLNTSPIMAITKSADRSTSTCETLPRLISRDQDGSELSCQTLGVRSRHLDRGSSHADPPPPAKNGRNVRVLIFASGRTAKSMNPRQVPNQPAGNNRPYHNGLNRSLTAE